MVSVHTLLSQNWSLFSFTDSFCLRGNFQGGRCIFPLPRQQGDMKILSSHSKTGVPGIALSCRLFSQWGRTLWGLGIVQDCYLWTGDCSCPGQMAAACAVFHYQSALWEIHTYQQPIAKSTWQLEKWPGGDKEKSFGWKQWEIYLQGRGGSEVFTEMERLRLRITRLKENIYPLPTYEQWILKQVKFFEIPSTSHGFCEKFWLIVTKNFHNLYSDDVNHHRTICISSISENLPQQPDIPHCILQGMFLC